MSAVTVKFDGRTAVGLRYVLPLCAEAVRHADLDGSSDTTEMLDGAARAIDAALPPELRGVIPDHEEAERRMDVIDAQCKAGVRREPHVPADSPQVLGPAEAREVAQYLEGSGRPEIQSLWKRLSDYAEEADRV